MSEQIQIRRYRADDVDAIHEAVIESVAELSRWCLWCHPGYTKPETQAWIDERPRAWDTNDEWAFVITDAHDRFLGSCGLHRIDLRNHCAELGYWVRTSATRQGIATKVTRLLCQYGFGERGLERIEIIVSVDNLASQRVAIKAGGVREGTLRKRIALHDGRHDCAVFSILKQDFCV